MESKEIRILIKNELVNLLPGFKLDLSNEGFSFTKNTGLIKYSLGGKFRNLTDALICDHFNSGITFLELEEIITPILIESEILGKNTSAKEQWTIGISKNKSLDKSTFKLSNDLDVRIQSNEDIINFGKRISKFYNEVANLFFTEWNSLMDFKDILEPMSPREVAQIFGTGGIFKKAVIYKLVSHKNYTEYIDKTLQNLKVAKELNPNEIQYSRFYNAALLVKERLI